MKKILVILLATFAFNSQALALFEVRAGYGVTTPSDDTADLDAGAGTVGLTTMTGFNLDGIVKLPMIPVGLGLRYENMGMDVEAAGVNYGTDLTRLSLLVNYRFIDTLIYVGAIGSIGFSNEAEVDFTGVGNIEYESDMTFTIGAEAGVGLGLLFVGAELGYSMAEFEAKNTANANLDKIDLSGIYAKVLVGFGF